MPSEQELEELISAIGPVVEPMVARAEQVRPDMKVGCLLGIVTPVVGLALAFLLPVPWPLKITGLVAGAIALPIGLPRLIRFAKQADSLKAPFQEQVLRPFADLLMPGAVLTRDRVSMDDWNRSRLFAVGIWGGNNTVRIVGQIAGLTAVLDETWWNTQNMIWSFEGWIVRFELPFAAARHLRARFRDGDAHVVSRGFDVLQEATARLGDLYIVDVGPLDGEPVAGLDPTALLTDGLFAWIRSDPSVQFAVAGRELWVALSRKDKVFRKELPVHFEFDNWRPAVRSFATAEAIALEVLAAGAAQR
jgi:hypothetical protein